MIEILMSTFNGERFLDEQIASISGQTSREWKLIIRDDGSIDTTMSILRRHAGEARGKIGLLDSVGKNLGACQSFATLLEHSSAEYVMFCDQDDVWYPEKVALTFAKLEDMEKRHGKSTPLLVFTDASVVDERLTPLAPSIWSYQNSDPKIATKLNRLLLMNPANGCTMMFNRALIDKALPIPPEALMHDSWLGLVAAAFGKVAYLPAATLLYRQHGKNESVTERWGLRYIFRRIRTMDAAMAFQTLTRRQAAAFLGRYHADLAEKDREAISAYVGFDGRSFLGKRCDIVRYRFFYVGIVRNIGWLITC